MLDYEMEASIAISVNAKRHVECFKYVLNQVKYHCFAILYKGDKIT